VPQQEVDQVAESEADHRRYDAHPGNGRQVLSSAERRPQRQQEIARAPDRQSQPKCSAGARSEWLLRIMNSQLRDMNVPYRSQ
jgi:hypothetical protein